MSTIKPSLGDLFSNSWEIAKKNIWILIGLLVGYAVISVILTFVGGVIGNTFISLIFQLASIGIGCIFSLGYVKLCLNVVDNKELNFSVFGEQANKLLKYLLASIIVGVVAGIGFVFLIVPGLWLMARLQFFTYFIVDENAGVIDSIQKSWNMTKGEDSYLLIWLFAAIFMIFVGLLCLGVGAIIASIVIYISQAVLFRYYRSEQSEYSNAGEIQQ